MRQEVCVAVTLTYDANASLSAEELHEAVRKDLCLLLNALDETGTVALASFSIDNILEEAAIYSPT